MGHVTWCARSNTSCGRSARPRQARAQDRQVDHIVADEADLLGREAGLFQQRVNGVSLSWPP
jgi:hypothetical protein